MLLQVLGHEDVLVHVFNQLHTLELPVCRKVCKDFKCASDAVFPWVLSLRGGGSRECNGEYEFLGLQSGPDGNGRQFAEYAGKLVWRRKVDRHVRTSKDLNVELNHISYSTVDIDSRFYLGALQEMERDVYVTQRMNSMAAKDFALRNDPVRAGGKWQIPAAKDAHRRRGKAPAPIMCVVSLAARRVWSNLGA